MASDLGAYLRRIGKYVGIGTAGATAASAVIALEPVDLGNISKKIENPAGIEARLQETPKPPEEIRYKGGVAYAQERNGGNALPLPVERVSPEEFYRRASPADEITPNARKASYNFGITNVRGGFVRDKWNDLYFKGNSELAEILKADKTLDFGSFDRYYRVNGKGFHAVSTHIEGGNGYLIFNSRDKTTKVVVPIDPETVLKLGKFR